MSVKLFYCDAHGLSYDLANGCPFCPRKELVAEYDRGFEAGRVAGALEAKAEMEQLRGERDAAVTALQGLAKQLEADAREERARHGAEMFHIGKQAAREEMAAAAAPPAPREPRCEPFEPERERILRDLTSPDPERDAADALAPRVPAMAPAVCGLCNGARRFLGEPCGRCGGSGKDPEQFAGGPTSEEGR